MRLTTASLAIAWNKDRDPGKPFFWWLNAECMQPASQKFHSIWPSKYNRDVQCPIGEKCGCESTLACPLGNEDD
jgi:hypothetical protein